MRLEYKDRDKWLVKEFSEFLSKTSFVVFCHMNNVVNLNERSKIAEQLSNKGIKICLINGNIIWRTFKKNYGKKERLGAFTIVYSDQLLPYEIIMSCEVNKIRPLFVFIGGCFISIDDFSRCSAMGKEIELKKLVIQLHLLKLMLWGFDSSILNLFSKLN